MKRLAKLIPIVLLVFFVLGANNVKAADIQLTCDHLDMGGTSCYFFADEHSITYTETDGFINPYPDTSSLQFHSGSGGTVNAYTYPVDGSVYDWQRFTVGSDYYFVDRTNFSPAPTSTSTRIESILPVNGSITASTSVDVSFDYYVNSSEFDDIEGLKIKLTQVDGVGSQEYEFNPITLDSLESVTHNFTLPTNTIWELNFYLERDPSFFINEFQLLYNSRFSIETDPTEEIIECDITSIAGCIQKLLLFLFRPSDASLHVFTNLYSQIKTKPPFGYGFAIQEELTNIDLTSDPAYEIPTFTPLMDLIFTPFRTALVWVFWFIFLFALFKRFSHIEL